jgi:hypothetical protein
LFGRAKATIRGHIEAETPGGQVAERDDEREDGDTEVVEEDPEEVEPTEEDLEDAAGTAAEPTAVAAEVESIQDVLEKQEARDEEDDVEDEPLAAVTTTRGEERLEPLDARVTPMQSTEFVCKNCYLVKHRSQLADKRRMLCRDCA